MRVCLLHANARLIFLKNNYFSRMTEYPIRDDVALTLTTRGESLASMQTISMGQSMPLIVLAYRFYQDVARYDELLQQLDPISPAFAPVSFRAALT